MHILVALLLLVLGGSALGGELVRYRAVDGSLGFVDDERRLPPGAVVLSRTPLSPPTAAAEAPSVDDAEAGVTDAGEGIGEATGTLLVATDPGDCNAYTARSEQLRCWQERGERCTHFGMALRCAPEDIEAAEDWCQRGESLRTEQPPIEEFLAEAVESHRACKSSARPGGDCSRDEVAEAERAAEVWELRLAALEEQCQEQGCLPGWVRESCEQSAHR